MSKGLRTALKGVVPERIWPLLRWFDKQLIYCIYIGLWLKRKLIYPTIPIRQKSFAFQSINSFPLSVEYQDYHAERILAQLKTKGKSIFEGRHSVYVHDVNDIEQFCPGLLNRYPVGFGLKIVKSQILSTDATPYYTSSINAPASTWFSMRAVGTMLEKMTVSNILYMEDVAPRVYDIVRIINNNGCVLYAFVVQHISGPVLTGAPAGKFMTLFKTALTKNGMETISIKEHRDLRGPEYNQNIVSGKTTACYVDIQNFVLADQAIVNQSKRHIWEHSFSHDLYRKSFNLLEKHNVPLKDQNILLIGSFSAGLLPYVLGGGAWWCSVGLHNKKLLPEYEKTFYLYGLSRFDLFCMDDDMHQNNNGVSFSKYRIICLDDKSLPWFEENMSKFSELAHIFFLSERDDSLKVLKHIVEVSTLEGRINIKIFHGESVYKEPFC